MNSDILNRELNNMAPTMATPQPMPQPQPVNQNTNPNNYNISNFANFDLLDI